MKRRVRWIVRSMVALAVLAALGGCSNKVWVMTPADVDLTGYQKIGLIEFTSSDPELQSFATQQFQQSIHEAQSGVRVLELGPERQVLKSVGHRRLDAAAIQAIAAAHDLDALLVGELDLTRIVPRLGVRMSLVEVEGSVEMQAVMTARLIESDGGTTVWTSSSRGTVTIASGRVDTEGTGNVSIADPTGAYAPLVEGLAAGITGDFRAHYARRKPEEVPPHYVPTYPDGVEVYVPPQLSSVTS